MVNQELTISLYKSQMETSSQLLPQWELVHRLEAWQQSLFSRKHK